ncbi:Hypothetical predicted protein [Xyrichtys novacula]|uniref:Uncharacterized protein n=1 Tax=Xyrichtys novacula TaxID=13765 RepID=A0AAV1H2C7_XYRNO|nr:Hypothetical predicted protein [Xyrichtys novacula]
MEWIGQVQRWSRAEQSPRRVGGRGDRCVCRGIRPTESFSPPGNTMTSGEKKQVSAASRK